MNRSTPNGVACVFTASLALLSRGDRVVANEPAVAAKRVIWASEPVVILPNQPKPMKYFQHLWGSSVYPLGNGRLGCTIYGRMAEEHIQFNEDTLRTGDEDNTGRFQNFGEMFITLTLAKGESRVLRAGDFGVDK